MLKLSDVSEEICKNIVSANGVVSLAKGAFEGREDLTEVTLPDSINIIYPDTFARCVALKNIHLPKKLMQTQARAFFACTSLGGIDLPEGFLKMGDFAFAYCTSLSEVKLPKSLREISANAFCGCENLKKIYLPENAVIIGGSKAELIPNSGTKVIIV